MAFPDTMVLKEKWSVYKSMCFSKIAFELEFLWLLLIRSLSMYRKKLEKSVALYKYVI